MATELRIEEQASFLDRHCGHDRELLTELRALLREDEQGTRTSLRSPVLRATASATDLDPNGTSASWLPEYVGPYKLLDKIGEGGMGSVWLAEQTDPISRHVALKFVLPGVDEDRATKRFEDERRTLAWMDHPGIARILDGGTTDRGLCWFAMEFAPGVPIDEYCTAAKCGLKERLELFVRVCDAVHHAHQKGIVHQDVKPSNVLVCERDGAPHPKLIDFGISRSIGVRPGPDGQASGGVGTLHYISPEQADPRCEDVDIRSDVYSLGVLLYKLVAGREPFPGGAFQHLSWGQIASVLRESRPDPASERSSLNGVHGELDWIIAAGMDPDPSQRYFSAAELAEDVRRFLRHEPLRVARGGSLYRARKALRRNRLAAVSAGAVLVALVAGVIGTALALFEVERQRDAVDAARQVAVDEEVRAQQVVRFLADTISTASGATMDPDVTVREMLDRAAGRISGSIDDPESEAILRLAMGNSYRSLGEIAAAYEHLDRAVDLLSELPGVRPVELYEALWSLLPVCDELDVRRALELVLMANGVRQRALADVHPRLAVGVRELRSAVRSGAEQLQGPVSALLLLAEEELPDGSSEWRLLAEELAELGFMRGLMYEEEGASVLFEPALSLLRRELQGEGLEVARHLLWQCLAWVEAGEFTHAESAARELLRICEASLPAGHWRRHEAVSLLAECRSGLGAAEGIEETLQASYLGLDAQLGSSGRATIHARLRWLHHLTQNGRTAEATPVRQELARDLARSAAVSGLWRRTSSCFPPDQSELVEVLGRVRDLFLHGAGDPATTKARGSESIQRLVALRPEPGDPLRSVVAIRLNEWASMDRGHVDAAFRLSVAREALELLGSPPTGPLLQAADAEVTAARALLEMDRALEALDYCEHALAVYRKEFGDRSYSTLGARVVLEACKRANGGHAEAKAVLTDILHDIEATCGSEDRLAREASSELALAQRNVQAGEM